MSSPGDYNRWLREVGIDTLLRVERDANYYLDSPLEPAVTRKLANEMTLHMQKLTSTNSTPDELRYAQGGYAQANRDILIVESLRAEIRAELDRRKGTK